MDKGGHLPWLKKLLCHSILEIKLRKYGLGRWTIRQVYNWLDSWAPEKTAQYFEVQLILAELHGGWNYGQHILTSSLTTVYDRMGCMLILLVSGSNWWDWLIHWRPRMLFREILAGQRNGLRTTLGFSRASWTQVSRVPLQKGRLQPAGLYEHTGQGKWLFTSVCGIRETTARVQGILAVHKEKIFQAKSD